MSADFIEDYKKLREMLGSQKYEDLAIGAENLLLRLLREIYTGVIVTLPLKDREAVFTSEAEIGEGKAVDNFDLIMISKLVSSFRLPDAIGNNVSLLLVRSYDYEAIATLLATLKAGKANEDPSIRLSLQHVLLSIVALLRFNKDFKPLSSEFLSEPKEVQQQVEAIEQRKKELEKEQSEFFKQYGLDPTTEGSADHKIFTIYKQRGLLVNPADDHRNVSFKVETFVNLLGEIKTNIIDKCQPKNISSVDENKQKNTAQVASEILFSAGYSCGLRFGRALYELFQRDRDRLSIMQKVERWCEFDSDVGFGRFINKLDVDEKKNNVSGKIVLSDNFLVANRDTKEENVCSFMAGYIQGVLEKIVRIPINVTHGRDDCEQYRPLKTECDFNVETIESNEEQSTIK